MKLLAEYHCVEDCEKGAPALKAYVAHVKSQKFSCIQT